MKNLEERNSRQKYFWRYLFNLGFFALFVMGLCTGVSRAGSRPPKVRGGPCSSVAWESPSFCKEYKIIVFILVYNIKKYIRIVRARISLIRDSLWFTFDSKSNQPMIRKSCDFWFDLILIRRWIIIRESKWIDSVRALPSNSPLGTHRFLCLRYRSPDQHI